MNCLSITTEEKNILLDHLTNAGLSSVRLRAQAVILKDQESTNLFISQAIGKSERTIRLWIENFTQFRISSIFCGHIDNTNANKLTKEQILEVRDILSKPPNCQPPCFIYTLSQLNLV